MSKSLQKTRPMNDVTASLFDSLVVFAGAPGNIFSGVQLSNAVAKTNDQLDSDLLTAVESTVDQVSGG